MKMLKDKKNRKLRIISFVILFLAAIVFLAPYFWMLSNSFKSTKEILLEPTNMLPKQFTLDGYVKVITDSPFFRWMGNSLFVTVIDTLVVLFTSSLIGFVLSKYKFKTLEEELRDVSCVFTEPCLLPSAGGIILACRAAGNEVSEQMIENLRTAQHMRV